MLKTKLNKLIEDLDDCPATELDKNELMSRIVEINNIVDSLKHPDLEIINGNVIALRWSYEDVLGRAEDMGQEINDDEAREILAASDHMHDACLGINWEVIDCHIDMFVQDRDAKDGK